MLVISELVEVLISIFADVVPDLIEGMFGLGVRGLLVLLAVLLLIVGLVYLYA